MKRKKKANWGCIAGALLVLFWAVVGILEVIHNIQGKKAANPFDTMAEQAKATCEVCFSQVSAFPTLFGDQFDSYLPYEPYLRGKILVVELDTGEVIGATMSDLPSELAAGSPEEVATLVCAGEIDQVQYTTYTDNQPGYVLTRDFCIYDLSVDDMIFAARIQGSYPLPVKSSAGPSTGGDPAHTPLIGILKGLPGK